MLDSAFFARVLWRAIRNRCFRELVISLHLRASEKLIMQTQSRPFGRAQSFSDASD